MWIDFLFSPDIMLTYGMDLSPLIDSTQAEGLFACCHGPALKEAFLAWVQFTCDGVRVGGVLLHIQNAAVQGRFQLLQLGS